jgi:hypothetical protein
MTEDERDGRLKECLTTVRTLEEENRQLRQSADSFGQLAERLNQELTRERRSVDADRRRDFAKRPVALRQGTRATIGLLGYSESCNSELRASAWTAMRFTTHSSVPSVRRKHSPSSRDGSPRPNGGVDPDRRLPLHVRISMRRSPTIHPAPQRRDGCSRAGPSD